MLLMSGRHIHVGAVFFLLPLLHPLAMPVAGVASHLLWFAHVLPVALWSFFVGKRAGSGAVVASVLLVFLGEQVVGGGFGVASPLSTSLPLAGAVGFADLLVAGFAWYARSVSHQHRTLFKGATVGIVRTDEAGHIVDINPRALEILNVGRHEVIGEAFESVLEPVDRLDSIHDGSITKGWSGLVRTPSGVNRHVLTAVLDLEEGGRLVVLADRSMEVMQERELDRHARLATLGEALAGVAHDLKNPLAVVMLESEDGLEIARDAEVKDRFTTIKGQADRMHQLVQELLGFSRPAADLDVGELHQRLETIAALQRSVVPKGIVIDTDLRAMSSVCVASSKLEQIVVNLISNAADAIGNRGKITVATRECPEGTCIDVADTGPGLGPELAERVFEPFFTTKSDGRGTGLGLAICRRLAESMGGSISVANRTPGGAQFTLALPTVGRGHDIP